MITLQSKRDKSRVIEVSEAEYERMIELKIDRNWKVIGTSGVSNPDTIRKTAISIEDFMKKQKEKPKNRERKPKQ